MPFAEVELLTGAGSGIAPLAKHGLMEDHMNDLNDHSIDVTPRREFFAQAGARLQVYLVRRIL